MYYDEYFPFYVVSANPYLYSGEKMQEEEFERMKSYYPGTARLIQEKVEEECDFMDYEGSRMYDEYPDKFMLYHTCRKIRRNLEPDLSAQGIPTKFLDELIQVLLYQEIGRRRCRRRRCRKFF